MELGTRVYWNFHGFRGVGFLDRIDGTRYYVRPEAELPSYSLFGHEPTAPWPFVVVYEDQTHAW